MTPCDRDQWEEGIQFVPGGEISCHPNYQGQIDRSVPCHVPLHRADGMTHGGTGVVTS